jgi:hypothetical protein
VARALVTADQALTGGRRERIILESLAWREIDVPLDASVRVGFGRQLMRGLPYSERWRLASDGNFY